MEFACILIFISCILILSIILKKYLHGTWYNGQTRLDGKTVIITGANSGIGKEVARDLARRGARVILACRNLKAAIKAASEICKTSGAQYGSNVVVKHLDLASLASVRHFAMDVTSTEERLDILINNAGVYHCPYQKTEDGNEMQFGVNHLGHFLLTNLLLPLLERSKPSRVITLTSFIYTKGYINFDDINSVMGYDHMKSYCQSKLANILFSRHLAKIIQDAGVTTYCVHPGVTRTSIGRHMWSLKPFLRPVMYLYQILPLFKDPEHGAQTVIFCAVEKSLEQETGKYYRECAEAELDANALDDGVAKKLWELSEQMTGLHCKLS